MPVIGLDMRELRLSEKRLEEVGLDLGANTQPMTYLDLSERPHRGHLFQHTIVTHTHVSPLAQEGLGSAPSFAPSAASNVPAGNEDPLRGQIRAQVEALDRRLGRAPDEASTRMELSLLVLAKQSGFERVDHVVLGSERGQVAKPGDNVFIVQGKLDDPAHLRAQMRTSDAIGASVSESQERLQVINQTQAASDVGQQQAPDRTQRSH